MRFLLLFSRQAPQAVKQWWVGRDIANANVPRYVRFAGGLACQCPEWTICWAILAPPGSKKDKLEVERGTHHMEAGGGAPLSLVVHSEVQHGCGLRNRQQLLSSKGGRKLSSQSSSLPKPPERDTRPSIKV
jgi:hypothetical protein